MKYTIIRSAKDFVLTIKDIKTKSGDIIPRDTVCEVIKRQGSNLIIEDPTGVKAVVKKIEVNEV